MDTLERVHGIPKSNSHAINHGFPSTADNLSLAFSAILLVENLLEHEPIPIDWQTGLK